MAPAEVVSVSVGRMVFAYWIEHPGAVSPHDLESETYWENLFRIAGPHEVSVTGRLAFATDLLGNPLPGKSNMGVSVATDVSAEFEPVPSLTPPAHLYRAARPGHEDRWNWFETFEMAKAFADDWPALRIWACEPGEVFAAVTIDRTEPGGFRKQWREWVVRPRNVREINRWRDPFAEVSAYWYKQGQHAIESASVVGSWLHATTSGIAPMDREGGEYWLRQFEQIGQFEADLRWDAADESTPETLDVVPAVDLTPPGPLFRGAGPSLRDRWSWTTELEAAQEFVRVFCPEDGRVWLCEPETVLGVVRCDIANRDSPLARFSEWLVIPKEGTVREWSP